MSDGEAVIRLDADVSAYINKVTRAQKATEDAGKGLSKTMKETETTTGKLLDGFTAWAAKVMTVSLVVKSLADGLRTVSDFQRQVGERSTAAGAKELQRSQSIQGLGLGGKEAGAMQYWSQKQSGAATADQRLAFLNGLSQYNQGLAPGMQLKPDQIKQMATLFEQGGEGVFGAGGKDMISGAGKYGGAPLTGVRQILNRKLGREGTGGDAGAMTQELLGSMSDQALSEISMRHQEGKLDRQADLYGVSDQGQAQRNYSKRQQFLRETDIGFAVNEAMMPDMVRATVEGRGRVAASSDTTALTEALRKQTDHLKNIDNSSKPILPNVKTRTNNEGNQ